MSRAEERGVDAGKAALTGEAAQMRMPRPEPELPVPVATEVSTPDYHGLPPLKAAPWKAYVPAYYFAGGLSGAASLLGAGLQLTGDASLRPAVLRCRRIGAASIGVGAALLIADLGRPARFLHMIRVFRPTSPMNLGTWVIGASGITSTAAAIGPGRLGDAAGLAAGALGPLLATYTAALLSNTATPVWQADRTMPLLFAGSSAATAGWALVLLGGARERRVARRLAVAGQIVELGGAALVERQLGRRRARPLRRGRSGALWRAGKWLGAAAVLSAATGGRADRVAAALGLAASAAVRFGLLGAASASVADPQAAFSVGAGSMPRSSLPNHSSA
jgi:formate-dependent nitrite reductase membrane component NrfD